MWPISSFFILSAFWRLGPFPKQGINRVRLRLSTSRPKPEAYRSVARDHLKT